MRAYSRIISGVARPAASVSLMTRRLASGVFSSCVTADTKSARITARSALARAARRLTMSPTASVTVMTAAIANVRRAPRSAAASVGSSSAVATAVHQTRLRSGGGSTATASGSKNATGNRRVSTGVPASGAVGLPTTVTPWSSMMLNRTLRSPLSIAVTCAASSVK